MAMGDLSDMYARGPRAAGSRAEGIHIRQITNGHVTSIMYQLCSHGNNTSSFNPTSNCHTCSQGYKYKLLMPYGQAVEHYYIQVTLCISNLVNDCDITLWLEIVTPLDQRFIHKLCA